MTSFLLSFGCVPGESYHIYIVLNIIIQRHVYDKV